jgi:hypothetical protein
MAAYPKNVRTKSPRGIALTRSAPDSFRGARTAITPTPPAVAVRVSRSAPSRSTSGAARAGARSGATSPDAAQHPVNAPARAEGRGWPITLMVVAAFLVAAAAWRGVAGSQWIVTHLTRLAARDAALSGQSAPAAAASEEPPPAELPRLRYDGHVPITGGVLLLPKSFVPEGGAYDLLIHFHGNQRIVLESAEHVGLNAAVAVINYGVGSAVYRDPYTQSGAFEQLLGQIKTGLKSRGVQEPKLRRLALSSWSAGFGAIESILTFRRAPDGHDPLDAVLALDGIHAGFVDDDPGRLKEQAVIPFVRAARAALDGDMLLIMTHSAIDTHGYASSKRTQRFILEQLGVKIERSEALSRPPAVALPSAESAVKEQRPLVPTSDTRRASLRVRGFEGNTPDDHAAHLTQMAAIALGDLVARWLEPFDPAKDKTKTDDQDDDEEAADEQDDEDEGETEEQPKDEAQKGEPEKAARREPASGERRAADAPPASTAAGHSADKKSAGDAQPKDAKRSEAPAR